MIDHLVRSLSLLLALGMAGAAAAETPPARPNIVVMMADDMGPGDTSVYLGKRLGPNTDPIAKTLRTPQLEDFAASGVVFTHAYAPASMCSSTRYSLLTGRYAHRSYLKQQGWLPHGPNAPMIQRALTTLPEMLQSNGYRTAAIGKYHVGMTFPDGQGGVADEFDYRDVDFTQPVLDGPTHHGFDEFFGVPGNTEESLDTEPRIFLRNDRWSFTDRARMMPIGMNRLGGRILAAPDWDLAQIGPSLLREALAFLDRQAQASDPFFLYYVPCANHLQRNESGPYAVPDSIAGVPVKGQSRYSDDSPGTEREDMVLENDIAFGKILEKLKNTDDPRFPGKKMIENTLVIFTSDNGPNVGDNLGRNPESGGLRGKKAKLWEGGIRVPFIASLPGKLDGGRVTDTVFSLTDLYATLAALVGHELQPHEAQDSQNSLPWWLDAGSSPDVRPRVFFCHLGPPFLNDTLAIRKGNQKLLVDGGLAMPWMRDGTRGASTPIAFYDLRENPFEEGEEIASEHENEANALARELLEIHNRGYGRDLALPTEGNELILDEGWHNLRNDVTGEVGFVFTLRPETEARNVTHLGMANPHPKDRPVRPARAVPEESGADQAGEGKGGRSLQAEHSVRLVRIQRGLEPEVLGEVRFAGDSPGKLEGNFRYLPLESSVILEPGSVYLLLLSTVAGDGDSFRDPASFDGLSPLVHPDFEVIRSVLVREGDLARPQSLPAFSDLDPAHEQFRLPVGPTLRFEGM